MAAVRRLLLILVPVLVLAFFVFSRVRAVEAAEAKQKAEAGARKGAAASVEVATAESRPIVQTIEAIGNVTSEFTVNLSPRISGLITTLQVREGDPVTAGQVLVRIDPNQAQAQILESKANVNESRSRLAQAQATIQASEVQIETNIRQARAELASAEATLQQVRKQIEGRVANAAATVRQSEAAVAVTKAEKNNRTAELTGAKATLKNEQIRLERVKGLFEKGYVAGSLVDNATAALGVAESAVRVKEGEVESAQADIEAAQAKLEADRTALTTTQASGQAEIQVASARVAQLKSAVTAAEANRAQSPANRANVNALQAGVESVEAQLQAAEAQRKDTELSSPFSGIVTARSADPGTLATPGQAVLRVESTDSLFIIAAIPVTDAARVRPGQPATIRLDGMTDAPLQTTVDTVVPSANPSDRQVSVRMRVKNPTGQIKPGMFAKVSIEIDRTDSTTVVPGDAIKDGSVSVVLQDGTTENREVKTGKSDARGIQILEGIRPGEKVIVLSYSPVKPGSKVSITAERRPDGTRKLVDAPKQNDKKSAEKDVKK
jgi:RND family efflux transporter MFP subunit